MNTALKPLLALAALLLLGGIAAFLWLNPSSSQSALERDVPAAQPVELPRDTPIEGPESLAAEDPASERSSMPKEAKGAPLEAKPASAAVETEATVIAHLVDENLRPIADAWLKPAETNSTFMKPSSPLEARTGSDGTGYALLTALGHTLVPPVPALTPLASPDPFCMGARGVTTHAALTLWVDGKKAETREGSLLFTHFGLSGPVALDLSRHWHRAEGSERRVTINFLPGESEDMLTAEWVGAGERRSGRGSRSFLGARLPERIADMLTAESGLGGVAMSQTPKQRRASMLRLVLERDLEVTATLGYEKAEATAGGVPLSEVNASTLESRIAPGLYLCGEVLDVEGRLGGFNFQWSWSSGTVAGRAAGADS